MDCPTEEGLIRRRLEPMEGVAGLRFDLLERQLVVTHALDDERDLLAALEALGMQPRLLAAPPEGAAARRAAPGPAPAAAAGLPAWLPLAFSGAAALAAEGIALATGREDSAVVIGLSVLAILASGREPARKGWLALRNRALNINFLMTVAVTGAVLIGQWPEAAMVTFLFGLAERIEGYSMERARNAIRSLMELAPATAAARGPDGEWRAVPVEAVQATTGLGAGDGG